MFTSHFLINQVTALTAVTLGLTVGGAAFLLSRGNKLRPCETCGGMGSWKCVICDGKGYIFANRKRSQCKACVGRGRRLCRDCNASGWNKRSNFIG